jgi:hypothetical protein
VEGVGGHGERNRRAGVHGVCTRRPNTASLAHLTRVTKPNPLNHAAPEGPYGIRTRVAPGFAARQADVSVAFPTDRDITRPSHEPPAGLEECADLRAFAPRADGAFRIAEADKPARFSQCISGQALWRIEPFRLWVELQSRDGDANRRQRFDPERKRV